MEENDEYYKEQKKTLNSILYELKRCNTYSRASKFYDKTIKSKKIREIMKTMGLIKINGFSDINLFNKEKKKKEEIAFNIKKIQDYLIRAEQEEKQKEIIKREKLNNTTIKKLNQMTQLNIKQYKEKHPYLPPSIGTYNPNYNSIYKKTKAAFISEKINEKKDNIIKNKSGFNIFKTLSLNHLNNSNDKKYATIETKNINHLIFIEKKEKDKNRSIFSYKTKYPNQYPIISRNKNNTISLNSLSNSNISSKKVFKIIPKIKTNFLIKESENIQNSSINSFKNNSGFYTKQMNSPKNTFESNKIDIFNKTKTYNIDTYFGNKSYVSKNKNLKTSSNNLSKRKKNLSHKTLYIKPSMPSIGYYNPNYDFIKESIPKISFLYHNINEQNDNLSYKKNLLRKIIIKYNTVTEYQVIKDLNKK